MIYQGQVYKGMSEVFNKALDIAENTPQEAESFLLAYANSILEINSICQTLEQALEIAKSNLGYFSGYCGLTVANLIAETYKCKHPIYDLV